MLRNMEPVVVDMLAFQQFSWFRSDWKPNEQTNMRQQAGPNEMATPIKWRHGL